MAPIRAASSTNSSSPGRVGTKVAFAGGAGAFVGAGAVMVMVDLRGRGSKRPYEADLVAGSATSELARGFNICTTARRRVARWWTDADLRPVLPDLAHARRRRRSMDAPRGPRAHHRLEPLQRDRPRP